VQAPEKFALIVNVKTAKALDLCEVEGERVMSRGTDDLVDGMAKLAAWCMIRASAVGCSQGNALIASRRDVSAGPRACRPRLQC
jgi:hypothetical protein